MKRYLVLAGAILGILLPLVLHTNGTITASLMSLLLGGVITLVGLLIFWGKQYYLVAGISPHSSSYSEIEKQKGRVLGGVTIGLGLLALLVGLVTY